MSKKDNSKGVETTGHSWDGIEEYNNPLPRWWLWTFYATVVWGLLYTVAYPAWPMIREATPGLLGYSTREEVAQEIAAVETANAGIMDELASADLTTLGDHPELQGFAMNAGASVFRNNCAQCHGSGANGAVGYPNLLDDAWLWGGEIDDIAFTVTNGVRNEQSPDTRYSEMPAFGDILEDEDIAALVAHVRNISGQDHDAALAETGAQLFADNCAVCHGDAGTGDRSVGAPNLTDAIWLYGGDPATLTETITYSRFGVMPAWSEDFRPGQGLSQAEINAVAAYVHGLGGGE
ncbi:cytochrome-c oxidase, cbb3-type subunit III [Mesobaculum littorinae]|uniref:Cbb3-type cytochrome c oxidase subunit n=1 Tax=Mesobaculum littorinae TaxID=2486419 RepID=A0A438ADE5_9RHOB|nr:cytochrome-c oxidase, cbb3-type subunit III [Mesobaculum littorinae]RVV96697.1 cytochrome-c oxidase, cbb3-type subunit III [Mesobaculum littorinae]